MSGTRSACTILAGNPQGKKSLGSYNNEEEKQIMKT
jgi:hypothetical protein